MVHEVRPFSCARDAFTIRGEEHLPQGAAYPHPLIISHGFTASMAETRPYAEYLAERGVHVYVFDFCGGGFASTSDGDFSRDMTPLTEVADLRAVLAHVRDANPGATPVLMGCSQGGFVSALVAPDVAADIRALVLMYPALCIPDDARAGRMQVLTFDPQDIPDVIGADTPIPVCGDYARSVIGIDTMAEIARYTGDVLIVHGTADAVVPVRYAVDAERAYAAAGAHVELHLLEGLPHGFAGADFELAAPSVWGYLTRLA